MAQSRQWKLRTIALASLLLAGAGFSAQNSPTHGPHDLGARETAKNEPPINQLPISKGTLRVTTTLVEVTVVARDKHGRPVTDLRQQDFRLYDEGELQKIQVFSAHNALSRKSGAAPLPPSSLPSAAQPAAPSAAFTNRSSQGPAPGAVTLILIDGINVRCEEWPSVRRQLIHFLRGVEPGSRIGIYLMSWGGIRVLHEVTQDSSALVKRLASWKKSQSHNSCAFGSPLAEDDVAGDLGFTLNNPMPGLAEKGVSSPGKSNLFAAGNPATDPTIKSLKLLADIAHHLAGFAGRKNIVWISDGFPLVRYETNASGQEEPVRYDAYERQAFRAMNQANIAMYNVEAHGREPSVELYHVSTPAERLEEIKPTKGPHCPANLVGNDIAGNSEMPVAKIWGSRAQDRYNALAATQVTLAEVSERTGGRAFVNTNDISEAARTADKDSRATYTLGFYPGESRLDGKFRRLQVEIVGRRDVNLTYRKGYVDARATSDPKSQLEDAVWSPLDATGIGLSAEMKPTAASYELRLVISADALILQPEGERWKGKIHLLVVQNDDRGGRYDYSYHAIQLSLLPDSYREILQSGVTVQQAVTRNPKAVSLRVIVLDDENGNLGSLTIPFKAMLAAARP
jgi:VWFA-related protein